MKVRKVRKEDVEALSTLARACFTDTFGHLYSNENLVQHMDKTCSAAFFDEAMGQDRIVLAEDDTEIGVLLGYIKYGAVGLPVDDLPENAWEIQRLYIHPKHQGKAIGRKLMDVALAEMADKQVEHIYLSVYEDNVRAQKFYQSYGFAAVGEYDYYVGTHIDREYIMYKKLEIGV